MKLKKKKISTILSADLLQEATALTKMNQTETLTCALQELVRSFKRQTIFTLRGKLNVEFNADKDRERSRF